MNLILFKKVKYLISLFLFSILINFFTYSIKPPSLVLVNKFLYNKTTEKIIEWKKLNNYSNYLLIEYYKMLDQEIQQKGAPFSLLHIIDTRRLEASVKCNLIRKVYSLDKEGNKVNELSDFDKLFLLETYTLEEPLKDNIDVTQSKLEEKIVEIGKSDKILQVTDLKINEDKKNILPTLK